jgi:putative chitinase
MITPEILQKLAPKTPKAKRDRFLPYLNEACPRYGIDTKLRLAAFLATICFESDHFKTTVEYQSEPDSSNWIKYQSKYWYTGFYGRGLIQLTKEPNYRAFNADLYVSGRLPSNINFVAMPEKVAEPIWAVESACWYWQSHDLNELADDGNFDGIQGKVNRGSAKRIALGSADRRDLYHKALAAIPSGFTFSPVVPEPSATLSPNPPTPSEVLASKKDTTTGDFLSKPSRFDRTTEWLKNKKEKLASIGVDPSQISIPSKLAIGANYAKGGILILAAFLWDNWWLLVLATALVIAGGFLYSRSKDRADARVKDGTTS